MTKTSRSKSNASASSSDFSLPKLEADVLAFWEKEKIFQKSLEKTKAGKPFVFFEGPPTANAKPGVHHVLARAFKDIIVRFQTMRGRYVERRAGWDTHGLPVEIQVEKELGFKGKKDIESYGIAKFNAKCKETVLAYKADWEKLTKRIGFWLDFERAYLTFTNDYIESLWSIMKTFFDRGILVEGEKVVPHCPRCGTALSSHEVALGYEDVTDTSVYVKFKVISAPEKLGIGETVWKKGVSVLSWTTTPWTLPGNVSLAVHPDIEYVLAETKDGTFILAKARLSVLEGKPKILAEFKGRDLRGMTYEPLFTFLDPGSKKAFSIAPATFVTTDEGTGVVHTAVMYGEDDYRLGAELDLPKVHTIGEDGRFLDSVKPWAGQFVKDAEPAIIQDLRDRDLLYKTEETTHSYPFCWRCGTPLLYYAKHSWFLTVSKFRKELIANNESVNWVPAGIKRGRFGAWLNEAKDWAFSRERYWGTPLPIWRCAKGHIVCVGSFDDLTQRRGKPLPKGFDPHRPFVDEITFACEECGETMRRVPEVADVWFDSGAMPFAQWHYPFAHQEKIDNGAAFPADYISEAIDQTRGWFYTLHTVSTLLGRGAPYKNVICLGHVLDEQGQKMSKSKGNVVDPWEVVGRFGADPLRFYLFTINRPGEAKRFSLEGIEEITKRFFLILWNVLTFSLEYASPSASTNSWRLSDLNVLDRWILSDLNRLVGAVTAGFEQYDATAAGRALMAFVDELSTWYLRRSRKRLRESAMAASVLRTVLLTVSRLLAPFTPFFSEAIYQRLSGTKESVHLSGWPEAGNELDEKLLREMDVVRRVVELGHRLRREHNFKVRQPLSQLVVSVKFPEELVELIRDELNVEEVHVGKKAPDETGWAMGEEMGLSVSLDVTISEELKMKGFIREIIRQTNDLRKAARLKVNDAVILAVETDDEGLRRVVERHGSDIKAATVAVHLLSSVGENAEAKKELVVDGKRVTLGITRTKSA